MKSKTTKFLALLMAAAVVFSLAGCAKKDTTTTTTAAGETTAEVTTVAGETTTATGDTTTAVGDTTAAVTTAVGDTTTVSEATTIPITVDMPKTNAQILAAYTSVMNKAKTDKPAFNKYEFQALPKDKINVTKASLIITPLLDLAGTFMTSESKAKANPGVYAKGNDMKQFPVKNAAKGCMLTDANAIKSASCVKLADGNYKLTIILKDDMNPEHYISGAKASSNTGNMFYPLSKSDVDPQLTTGTVKAVISKVNYSLNYYDCTATLIYNPKTNQAVSLDQVTYSLINMSGTVLGFIKASGTAVLEMHYSYFNVKY